MNKHFEGSCELLSKQCNVMSWKDIKQIWSGVGFSKGEGCNPTRCETGPGWSPGDPQSKKRKNENSPRCLITKKRSENIVTASELPTILNVNPCSVYNKQDNLRDFILERNMQIVGISESWERVEDPLEDVLKMDGYQVISNPFARKQVGKTSPGY